MLYRWISTELVMITQKRLKEVIQYKKETGIAYWKERSRCDFDANYAGNEVGCVANIGGRKVITCKVDYKQYYLHRLIFLYYHGWMPIFVDHINGNSLDNRICNLRDGSNGINNKNCKKRTDNTSGVGGIYKHTKTGKWVVRISIKGKRKHFGCFDDFFEACCVRFSVINSDSYTVRHGR